MSDQNETETTFTQEDVDKIISERLARQKSQIEARYSDYEELKEKAGQVDNLNKSVEELTSKLTEAESKVEESEKRASEAEVNSLRVKVSSEHGVPLKYLSASDEETLVEQAKELAEWKGANRGVTREAEHSGNSSGPAKDAKARAREALANFS